MRQLDLFLDAPIDYDQIITDLANELLDLLNMDRKPKEKYFPAGVNQITDKVVIIAKRGEDHIFNVIDQFGNMPDYLPVNWRNLSLIERELNLKS